ncbi:MAG: hypothetical protein GX539_00795 [Candidatus Cloacimonetes bacterium]|nr:hypothetical protein [Candidatus Cloacimonadota bacterium]
MERDFAELASEARADNAAVRVLGLLHALSDAVAHRDDTDRPSLFRCRSRRGTQRDLEFFLVESAR